MPLPTMTVCAWAAAAARGRTCGRTTLTTAAATAAAAVEARARWTAGHSNDRSQQPPAWARWLAAQAIAAASSQPTLLCLPAPLQQQHHQQQQPGGALVHHQQHHHLPLHLQQHPGWRQHTSSWRPLHTSSAVALQQQQQQQHQELKQHAEPSRQAPSSSCGDGAQQQQQPAGSSFTSLPNLLSLSRVALSPALVYAIASQQWPAAVGITAYAGVSDWLDGFLARRLGHTSKLGSYLDPLADKVFVCAAVGTMGTLSMLPAWLALLVVGRDTAQVAGMFAYRLRMFGGSWPGAAAFFDVDSGVQQQQRKEGPAAAAAAAAAAGGSSSSTLPVIRPLLVSKANTALIMVLAAGCMAHQWQGVPAQEVLDALELMVGGTTAASAAAYGYLHWRGRLLSAPAEAPGPSSPRHGGGGA